MLRKFWPHILIVALVAAFVILQPKSQPDSEREELGPFSMARALNPHARTPASPQWAATPPPSARGRAVRAGALLIDYARARLARDTSESSFRLAIASYLESAGAQDSAVAILRRPPADTVGRAKALIDALATLGMGNALAGAWLEGARLSADARDTSFFRAHPGRRAITTLGSDSTLTAVLRQMSDAIAQRPLNADALGTTVRAVLEAAAR